VADFVDDLFDDTVAEDMLRAARLQALNVAKARGRALDRLSKVPLPAEKAEAAMALVEWMGVERIADRLRAIFADVSAPQINRAVAVTALYWLDLDPGVPAVRLPDLAEGVLLGNALCDEAVDLNDLVAALLRTELADAVIARIEAWRLRLAVPPDRVYARALGLSACAHAHAAILASIDHTPETVQMVRDAHVAPSLFSAYITRPQAFVSAAGGAWHVGNCHECGGAIIQVLVELGDSATLLSAHMSATGMADGVVTPMAGPSLLRRFREVFSGVPAIPLGRLAAAALHVHGHGPADERALWLLRQIEPAEEGIDDWLIEPDDGFEDALEDAFEDALEEEVDPSDLLERLADPGDDDAVLDAADALVDGLYEGRFATRADDVWHRLFDAYLALVDRDVRWGQPAPQPLLEWIEISRMIGEVHIDSATLPVARLDRIDWRSLLAELVAEPTLELGVARFARGAKDLDESLERTRQTPGDAAADLGAPPDVARALAAALGVDVDQPIFEAFR
jgi:hypothetical protein